jgi:GNAT superfamily N-acetyltransferase
MTSPAEQTRVRAATPGDAPAIAALLEQLGYPTTIDAAEARLSRLAISPADDVLVAEQAGVGVAGLLVLHRAAVLHHDLDVAIIMALVVDELRRGLGIGERLVRWAAAIARERGCERLQVTTHLRRADAHRFYERLGFEHTGRRYVLSLE